jgi:hypothetical protein
VGWGAEVACVWRISRAQVLPVVPSLLNSVSVRALLYTGLSVVSSTSVPVPVSASLCPPIYSCPFPCVQVCILISASLLPACLRVP